MLEIKDEIIVIVITHSIKYVLASLQNAKYVRVTTGIEGSQFLAHYAAAWRHWGAGGLAVS